MNDHDRESVREMAAAYALGSLDPGEAADFEALIAESDDARRELAEYGEVSALLAHGGPVLTPSPALRERLLQRIGAETPREPDIGTAEPDLRPKRNWSLGVAWAAALTGLTVAGVQTVTVRRLTDQVADNQIAFDRVAGELSERERVLREILGSETVFVQLDPTTAVEPRIRLFWNKSSNRVVVHAYGLEALSADSAYQLWFLPEGGEAPVPSDTFRPDADGAQTLVIDGPDPNLVVVAAAVTREPAGGSTTPTMPILLLGEVAPE